MRRVTLNSPNTFLRWRLWTLRNKFIPWLPFIVRLPQVGWWLAWNDFVGGKVYLSGGYEESEQTFLLRFLQPGMVAFDIGAHHGFHTLLMSRQVGSQGLVIAFEPSPREVRRLQWILTINHRSNVRVESCAVSNKEGEEQLFVCMGRNTGCNSLRKPAVSEGLYNIGVFVTTLDRYLHKHEIRRVDLLKIDVEGAMNLLNSNSRPVVICELDDRRTLPWGYPAYKIYDVLNSWGYSWYSVIEGSKLNPCARKEQYQENLVAVPQEKLPSMKTFVGTG